MDPTPQAEPTISNHQFKVGDGEDKIVIHLCFDAATQLLSAITRQLWRAHIEEMEATARAAVKSPNTTPPTPLVVTLVGKITQTSPDEHHRDASDRGTQ